MKYFNIWLLILTIGMLIHCGQADSVSVFDPEFDISDTGSGAQFLGEWQVDASVDEQSCGSDLENGAGSLAIEPLAQESATHYGNCNLVLKGWSEQWPAKWPDNWPEKWNQEWPTDIDEMSCKANGDEAVVVFYSRASYENCHVTGVTTIHLQRSSEASGSGVTGALIRTLSPGNTCPTKIYKKCTMRATLTGQSVIESF